MFSILKNNETAQRQTNGIGRFGEERAAEYLRLRGYRIAVRNFRTAIGRNRKGVALNGEIDLVAIKSKTICFVEVKTRSNTYGAAPETAVTKRKQRQITRTAAAYMRLFEIQGLKPRFDVIAVIERGKKAPEIRHLKDFWAAGKFKKKGRRNDLG